MDWAGRLENNLAAHKNCAGMREWWTNSLLESTRDANGAVKGMGSETAD